MRNITIGLVGLLFAYLFYGLVVSWYDFDAIPKDLAPRHPEGFYDYAGVINVHTAESSGSGKFTDVVESAKAAGLNFMILTDLNNFDKQKDLESYYDQVLVFIGGEYNYLDSRLLNFDASNTDQLMGRGRAQMVFAELLSRQNADPDYGFFVLAHPLKPGFKWRGDYPEGLSGIEVFNLKTIWQDSWLNDRSAFIGNLLMYPFNPDLSVIRIFAASSRSELTLWDNLNLKQKVVGFAGSDAESRVRAFGRAFDIPSYESLFSIMKNHVILRSELTGNASADSRKIADALRAGQFYMSLDLLANPKGFNSYVKSKTGEVTLLGGTVKASDGMELIADLPVKPTVPFETVLIKDGDKIASSTSARTSYAVHGPGSYRIMVRLKVTLPPPSGRIWVPWIFTNPIQIQ
jgi:hypothetical protein